MEMDITGISGQSAAYPATPAEPSRHQGQARDVAHAVGTLNATQAFGPDNELLFQVDARTQRIVIQVVNRETREVVNQIPAEYLLQMAADLKTESK